MNFRDFIIPLFAPKPSAGMLTPGLTVYGDSIMEGTVSPFLKDIGKERGVNVIDRAVAGDTAKKLWLRFPYEARATDKILLQVGTNDITLGDDPIPSLLKIVKYAQGEGRRVFFTSLMNRIVPLADHDRFHNVQTEIMYQLLEAGAYPAVTFSVPYTGTDCLHPDAVMGKLLARTIADEIFP